MDPLLRFESHGPFTADGLPEESRYELVNGHPMYCAPSGDRHGSGTTRGAAVIDSDPAVSSAGVDVGYVLDDRTVRAPDVSITPGTDRPGFIRGVPPLAVEYADQGQDESELQQKVAELLEQGTRYLWVVRLTGPPRVEVYTPDGVVGLVRPGQLLEAPGLLELPIPMEAFYSREVAHKVTLRNLLARAGYRDLDDVLRRGWERGLSEGKAEGKAEALLQVLAARGLPVSTERAAEVRATTDGETLDRWIQRAAVAQALQDVFGV